MLSHPQTLTLLCEPPQKNTHEYLLGRILEFKLANDNGQLGVI